MNCNLSLLIGCVNVALFYYCSKRIYNEINENNRRIELYDRRSEINIKQFSLYADKVLDKYKHLNVLLGNYKELKEDKDLTKLRESLDKLNENKN